MNYREAAQTALDVQDACNLSGVVHSLDKVVDAVWEEARRQGKGTAFVNESPIVYLYLDKLMSLNRRQCLCSDNIDSYSKATAEVEAIAKAVETPA
jgi:hypothetical protein